MEVGDRVMEIFDKISYWVDLVFRTFITIFLIIMTTILAIQIGARSIFQMGIIWTDELARFLMVAMVYLGAAVATRDRSHITVSIFEDFYPSLRKWLAPVQWIVMLSYAVLLIKFGLDTIEVVGAQKSPNMRISMGLVYAVLPLSAAVMVIHLIGRIGKRTEKEEEVKE